MRNEEVSRRWTLLWCTMTVPPWTSLWTIYLSPKNLSNRKALLLPHLQPGTSHSSWSIGPDLAAPGLFLAQRQCQAQRSEPRVQFGIWTQISVALRVPLLPSVCT